MYYSETPSRGLRFGDIVKGYVAVIPKIVAPFAAGVSENYTIEIQRPPLLVVLTPCCSITDKTLLLAPLLQLRKPFFDNPYFTADFTRINRPMRARDSLPADKWNALDEKEQANRAAEGEVYVLLELFVFGSNDLLPAYTVSRRGTDTETRAYMVDFRHTYRIGCEAVVAPDKSPIDTKILELSIQAREELRRKISHFYARVPDEDRSVVAASAAA